MEKSIENAVLECKLQNDKRWAKMEVDLQKVRDDVHNIIHSDLRTMEVRLNKQAEMVGDIQQLSLNVASLSQNMQQMLEEMRNQNIRLNQLEQKPLKRWDTVIDVVVKLVLTAAVGAILVKIGLQ